MQNPRSGRRYMRAIADLKARGEVQVCWRQRSPRCPRVLYAAAPKGHPQSITLGHIIAAEERPDLFWESSNHAPECPACNYADGADRTNAKRRARRAGRPTSTPARKSFRNPRW